VQVIAPLLPDLWNEREGRGREEPLPDELFGGVLVFLFELPAQKCTSVAGRQVLRNGRLDGGKLKTSEKRALQPRLGGVQMALMKRNLSSAERGVWITPRNGMLSTPV
jgi:hypothetical protein